MIYVKSQYLKIARNELIQIYRNRIIISLMVIIVVLLAIALIGGYQQYIQQKKIIDQAQHEQRLQWLNQGEKHPHMAAHFGTFIFKPKTLLSIFDFGLDSYTGTSVYLEAHYQHEFMFRPAQDSNVMIRFGELSAALVMQVLMPLLIIFLCFSSISAERERGTWRLLMSQGITARTLALGKILAYSTLIILLFAPLLVLSFASISLLQKFHFGMDEVGRILLTLLGYSLYVIIFISVSVLVSAFAKESRNALLALLVIWVLAVIIVPKTVANIASSIYPLPSMKEFKEAIKQSKDSGIDGKSPYDMRMAILKESYLKKYNVDSIQNLPMNFDAVMMQANENYGNMVHDLHWDQINKAVKYQNDVSAYASLFNPYIAIRNISMGLAQTDFYTSTEFEGQAEQYRRALVERMNRDMEENTKYGEFYEYKAGPKLWNEIAAYAFRPQSVWSVFSQYRVEVVALCLWLIGVGILVQRKIR